jgi:hypothetical protein
MNAMNSNDWRDDQATQVTIIGEFWDSDRIGSKAFHTRIQSSIIC